MEIKKDVGSDCIDIIDKIEARLSGCIVKAERAIKKNAQLHILLGSGVLEKMKQNAESQGVSLSEWCRKKLQEDSQLTRIEKKIERLLEN